MTDLVVEYLRLLDELEMRTLTERDEDDLDRRIESIWLRMSNEERQEADHEQIPVLK